ncbi:FUSC family protein [Enterococcus nangangensis]|uniref:FUSC family protein n=1 Tax=Enterococcus nangangensis TaxID=2559926 RepID=UPI0010F7A28D|nr:aromatic acid exporter family protein [Enterococcus nangangensis]
MNFGPFRLGMRTMKTALAVALCVLLFHYTNRGAPMIAALSAVFSLRQDLNTSISFGKTRILGNCIGGTLGLVFYLLQNHFGPHFWFEVLILPLLVIITIVFSDGIHNNSGIISGISTLLLVALGVPSGENFTYAINRVLDTFIGTTIAITLNLALQPKPQETKRAVEEDLAELRKKEAELSAIRDRVAQHYLAEQHKKNQHHEP